MIMIKGVSCKIPSSRNIFLSFLFLLSLVYLIVFYINRDSLCFHQFFR